MRLYQSIIILLFFSISSFAGAVWIGERIVIGGGIPVAVAASGLLAPTLSNNGADLMTAANNVANPPPDSGQSGWQFYFDSTSPDGSGPYTL